MTSFVFTELVPSQLIESAALGVDANGKFKTEDLGKPVKLAGSNNFVLAAADDEIEGFVNSVDPFNVNDGFSFGGVLRKGRKLAVVGANQSGTMAVGDLVVADTQVALGTAGSPKVKTGTAFGATAVRDGTAQAGGAADITLDAGASATNDAYNGMLIQILAGTGAGQSRVITDYVGATKVASVAAWGTAPDNTSKFSITQYTEASPKHAKWKVIRIVSGTGVPGDTVLLERL